MIDGIDLKSCKAIIDILRSHAGVERAVLFGSRAMGTFTSESDIDICLIGRTLTLTDQAQLAARFERLPIPQKVDVLRYHTITNDALRLHIDREGKLLYSANAQPAD
jgi:predicted nucleotidyltransferase